MTLPAPQPRSTLLIGTLRRCERLLALGVPVVQVSKQMQVGRKAVSLIRDRKHPLQAALNVNRCRICGGLVQQPCQRCVQLGEVA